MPNLLFKMLSQKKQISRHISKFEFNFGFLIFSMWLVEKDGYYFLVDTGLSGLAKFALNNYFPQELKAVFLTHGHADHIRGLSEIRRTFADVPAVIDRREFPYIAGQLPYPKRKRVETVVFEPATFLTVDSPAGQELLNQAGLVALFTPGHSPGHTCYYHEKDRVMIAGDLFTTSQKGKLRPPMKQYTGDMAEALASGGQLLQSYPQELFSFCHGKEVKNALAEFEAAPGFREVL